MKNKIKKLLAASLATVVVFGCLAGCGGNNTANNSTSSDAASSTVGSEAAPSGNANLTVAWWGNQTRNERTQQVMDLYSGKTGIGFDGQFSEWGDYWTKLSTASAGHALPDVVQMDYSYIEQYVANDLLVDLTPYIESGVIDLSNVSEAVINMGKMGGGIYAIASGVNAPTLVYNKTLLDENGISVHDNMTLDEFFAIAKEVYEKTGYKTDVFYQNGDQYMQYYMRGIGSKLYGDGAIGASDKEVEDFFAIYQKGIEEGWMCEPAVYAERTIGTPEQMPIVYGSSPSTMAWCSFTWSNGIAALRAAAPEGMELGLTTWPADDPRVANYLKPGMFWSISVDSANPDAAAEFMNYWTNDIEANEILLAERGIPISSAVADAISSKVDQNIADAASYINDVVTPNCTLIDPPSPAESAEIIELIKQTTEKVCYGNLDAAAASAEFMDKAAGIYNK